MRIHTKIPVLLLSAAALTAALTMGPGLGLIADAQQAGRPQPPGGATKPAPKLTALVGGKIRTMADDSPAPFEGVVLIRGGTIEAVGPTSAVTIPEEAEIINVAGMTVTPGLIDAHGALWLDQAERREQASDSSLDLLDAIDPYDASWREIAKQGVTSVYVHPSGFSGGPGALMRVGPARGRPGQAFIQTGLAAHAAPSGTNSVSRFDAVNRVRGLLDSAKSYGEAFKKYEEEKKKAEEAKKKGVVPKKEDEKKGEAKKEEEKKPSPTPTPMPPDGGRPFPFPREGRRRGPVDEKAREEMIKKFQEMMKSRAEGQRPSGSGGPKAPTKEFGKDALLKVVEKQSPLRVEAHDDDTIKHLLKLADDLKIKLILEGLGKPGPALKEAIDRRIPLVLGPMFREPLAASGAVPSNLPPGLFERFPEFAPISALPSSSSDATAPGDADGPPALPSDLRWALGTHSDDPIGSRGLRIHAALAVAKGLDPESVLAAITSNGAKVLGVSDKLGTLAPGKRADIAVFAGDPLDPSVPTRLAMSAGEIVYRNDSAQAVPSSELARDIKPPTNLPAKYLIKSTRILGDNGEFAPGRILVEGGKIARIDRGDAQGGDTGVPLFDVGSAVVAPGLVSAAADLGLGREVEESSEADAGWLRASDVYDPSAPAIRSLMEGGVLTVALVPGSGNVVAGGAAGVRLGASDPIIAPLIAEKFVLSARSRNAQRFPASLSGQVEYLNQALSGNPATIRLTLPDSVRQGLESERASRLTTTTKGERPVLIEVSNRSEVQGAIRLIERFKLKAALIGRQDVGAYAADLKRLGAGLIATPIRTSEYDRRIGEVAKVSAAGVPVAFGEGSALELRVAAALAVNAGMPRSAALRGLTSTAASLTGMPESAGKLTAGGPADFVIWTGSPLDLRSKPLRVVVDGREAAVRKPSAGTSSSAGGPRS